MKIQSIFKASNEFGVYLSVAPIAVGQNPLIFFIPLLVPLFECFTSPCASFLCHSLALTLSFQVPGTHPFFIHYLTLHFSPIFPYQHYFPDHSSLSVFSSFPLSGYLQGRVKMPLLGRAHFSVGYQKYKHVLTVTASGIGLGIGQGSVTGQEPAISPSQDSGPSQR